MAFSNISDSQYPNAKERFIVQILLELPFLVQQSECSLGLPRSWGRRRRRTVLDFPPESTSVIPQPPTLSSPKNVNESSPTTLLSLDSQSEEADENNINVKASTKNATLNKMDRCSSNQSKNPKIGSSNSDAMEMAKPSLDTSTTDMENDLQQGEPSMENQTDSMEEQSNSDHNFEIPLCDPSLDPVGIPDLNIPFDEV